MADICDKTEEAEARILALRLKHVDTTIPKGTGRCLYCDEPIPDTHRWCDASCRDDYEKQQRAAKERPN